MFVDRRVLFLDAPPDRQRHVSPAVEGAIDNLAEAGHHVVILGDLPETLVGRQAVLSADEPVGPVGWLVTGDRRDCGRTRRHGLRTILVGPNDGVDHPTERCDEQARDLPAAALVILAAEAMRVGG